MIRVSISGRSAARGVAVMKIWISQRAQKGGYAVHLLAQMAGILVLAVVLAVLGGIAPLVFGWPRELSMLLMVLGVTALGATLEEALDKAYAAVGTISFEGAMYRKDIGRTHPKG